MSRLVLLLTIMVLYIKVMFLQDEDIVCEDIPQHVPGMEHIFTVTNSRHTKLFLPANILSSNSNMTEPLSTALSYSYSSKIIAQQKKALEWYEQLPPTSERKKRIQKAQNELALDDWSDIDVSMLDSEMQQKLLIEATESIKQTKISTEDSLSQCNADSAGNNDDEVFELRSHDANPDGSTKNSMLEFHSKQSCQNELQHNSSQTPLGYGDSFKWNCQGFDSKCLV